jgi:hypothetical protein
LLAEPEGSPLGIDNLTSVHERLRARARSIDSLLENLGVTDSEKRAELLAELAAAAESSGLARSLLAGEIVLGLLGLEGTHLMSAVSGGPAPRVVLDASVAIPLLCARLYEPFDLGLFLAAERLSRQLQAHELPVVLPRDYLEEVASHLVNAYRDYTPILDMPDPDLVACRNAFVAMYVALRQHRVKAPSFASFVQSLGCERPTEPDFHRARDAAARRRLLAHLRNGIVSQQACGTPSTGHVAVS